MIKTLCNILVKNIKITVDKLSVKVYNSISKREGKPRTTNPRRKEQMTVYTEEKMNFIAVGIKRTTEKTKGIKDVRIVRNVYFYREDDMATKTLIKGLASVPGNEMIAYYEGNGYSSRYFALLDKKERATARGDIKGAIDAEDAILAEFYGIQ